MCIVSFGSFSVMEGIAKIRSLISSSLLQEGLGFMPSDKKAMISRRERGCGEKWISTKSRKSVICSDTPSAIAMKSKTLVLYADFRNFGIFESGNSGES